MKKLKPSRNKREVTDPEKIRLYKRKLIARERAMIKSVTQYVIVCDNAFCDSTMRAGVDFHSYDRREQFKQKVRNRGWEGIVGETDATRHICPSCRDFDLGVYK